MTDVAVGHSHTVSTGQSHVYGAISLVFWSVMVIVTLTYVTLVMRMDNGGERRNPGHEHHTAAVRTRLPAQHAAARPLTRFSRPGRPLGLGLGT